MFHLHSFSDWLPKRAPPRVFGSYSLELVGNYSIKFFFKGELRPIRKQFSGSRDTSASAGVRFLAPDPHPPTRSHTPLCFQNFFSPLLFGGILTKKRPWCATAAARRAELGHCPDGVAFPDGARACLGRREPRVPPVGSQGLM